MATIQAKPVYLDDEPLPTRDRGRPRDAAPANEQSIPRGVAGEDGASRGAISTNSICHMLGWLMSSAVRKITVNLPEATLARAQAATKKGITATLIEALEALDRQERRSALRAMRGKVRFDLDLEKTRR